MAATKFGQRVKMAREAAGLTQGQLERAKVPITDGRGRIALVAGDD